MPVVYPTTWIPCHAQDEAQSPQACGLRGLCWLVCNFPWLGWTSYQVTYRDGETIFQIRVDNASGVNRGVRQVTLDGKVLPGNEIPLLDDGRQHQVQVLMG